MRKREKQRERERKREKEREREIERERARERVQYSTVPALALQYMCELMITSATIPYSSSRS